MSKERLEDVRETMAYIKMCESKEMHNQEQADMAKCYLIERHGDWLIEQAERVEELENENRILKTVAESNKYIGEQYLEQNKRYRVAITDALSELRSDNTLYKENVIKAILEKALEGEE